MNALAAVALLLVAAAGTAVVATKDPLPQAFVNSFYGLALVVLFVAFQSPEVALSVLVVSVVAVPFLTLVALSKV